MKLQETEVISKITREIFSLFKIDNNFTIENDLTNGVVTTRLTFDGKNFFESGVINPAEIERAEIHRLIKRNLYNIFIRDFKKESAPYGIMHGVRPMKIVHRWLRAQPLTDPKKIIERLKDDYLVSEEKAKLLTEIALRQIPILKNSTPNTVSIYAGIPFCVTRCLYCSFPSNILPSAEKISDFMTVLKKDVDAAQKEIQRHNLKVQNIYVGGGTPTALPNIFFAQMLEMIYAAFYHKDIEEFTVECGRPDTITAEKIAAMKSLNVTRVSVNPQTMQQRTLDIIGRRHSPQQIIDAFNDLRSQGNFQINMDLILGLPGETVADVKDSVEKVIALNPDDITLHALAIKKGSRLQMNIADNVNDFEDFNLPSDEVVRKMSKIAENLLRQNNFQPYYLYRQGYMSGQIENVGYCKNNAVGIYNIQIMDERQHIIGVGGAATTKVVDFKNNCLRATFNPKELTVYMREIDHYIKKRTDLLSEVLNK